MPSSGRMEEREGRDSIIKKYFASERRDKRKHGAMGPTPTISSTSRTNLLLEHTGERVGHIRSMS